MEQGGGSSIPWEKGVSQSGSMWIPSTPNKPVVQSSNNAQLETQLNQIGGENWHSLMDLYEDILQNKQPHSFDLNISEGPSYEGVASSENYSTLQQDWPQTWVSGLNRKVQNRQDVAHVEAYNRLPLNSVQNDFTGVNNLEINSQNNLAAGRNGFNSHNSGELVSPQEVNSFADLVSVMNSKRPSTSNGSLYRSSFCEAMPTITCPVSQVESNLSYASIGLREHQDCIFPGSNASVGVRAQQNHILHGSNQVAYAEVGAGFPQSYVYYENYDSVGYNRQDVPNSEYTAPNSEYTTCTTGRPSAPRYALNLTPRSEARESSSASRSSTLGPVTPDQQKIFKTHTTIQVPQLLIESATPEINIHGGSAVLSSEPEILDKEHSDIVAKSMVSSTAAIPTFPQEVSCPDGGNGGIDVNKTPPQKTPKRKHRPKVLREGKPKRSPKSASTKNSIPEGNPPAKTKYMRRSGTNNSTPPATDTVKVDEASDLQPAKKSSKRKLNFDMETVAENRVEKEGQGSLLDHQEQNNDLQKLCIDSSGLPTSEAKAGLPNTCDKERRQWTPTAYNFVTSINNIPPQESTPLKSATLTPRSRDRSLNIIARSFSMASTSMHQSNSKSMHNQMNQYISRGSGTLLVLQENQCEQNLGFGKQSSVQTMPQFLEYSADVIDKQGTKRAYMPMLIASPQNIAFMGSQPQSHRVPNWQSGSGTCDQKSIEYKLNGTSISMQSGFRNPEQLLQQMESRRNKSLMEQISTDPQNDQSRNSDCRRQAVLFNPNDDSTNIIRDHYMHPHPDTRHEFQQQRALSQVHLCSESKLPKTPFKFADTQITKSATAVINRNESISGRDTQSIPINGNINSPLHAVVKKRNVGLTTYEKEPVVDKVLHQEPRNKKRYGNSSKKVAGMKNLHITNSGKELHCKEQTALVPYQGDGAVVPYTAVKKRMPRPRVDLDPETNRLWNLLMGKEGGESAETMDSDKEKWWEEERKVFRGRVDSFIARMHLVQGDRRFSKWKGSVVDSVIGVFLTQNVSDHLSSSAFMCLAAKFPLKSAVESYRENGGRTTVGNHEVRITYPDGTSFHQKMGMEPVSGHSQVTSTKTSTNGIDNVTPEKKNFLVTNHYTGRTEEDIFSSQSSSESFVFQATEDLRSSSGSNSDAECGWNVSKNLGHQSVPQQDEGTAELQQNKFLPRESLDINKALVIDHGQFEKPAYSQQPEPTGISEVKHHQSSGHSFPNSWTNMLKGIENSEAEDLTFLGRGSISTLTSQDSKGIDARSLDDYGGQSAESDFMVSQDGRSTFQTSSVNDAVLQKGLELQNYCLDEPYNSNSQHCMNTSEKQVAFHHEGILLLDPGKPAEPFSKQPSDNRNCTEVEIGMGQRQSPRKLSRKISITTPNAREQKVKKENAEPFDWDTLRKQVQSKAGTTGRSREAMDSLDYEAMLNADVSEISDTIKERGMNNLLAERMKNFLKRLVDDHERIDLEWLRDVEPDKAKDYLLSIRGLGLKSVECIRLLTLHHLAFPVDTNVGRIAVRLGWVPLQPLPESLQLHLLELYPILESIQKYLWPRLCKLDQETLYELHYQMITFGKVFCTKRDPNCNACPLRGECRHFASAFASARLALPGPQDRHIVLSSAAPKSANNSSDVIIKLMALPPPEDTMDQQVRPSRDCEPLIEEPATPEPPIEVEERDIEDAFYEDPDEIPVIKLNIEEFTSNLQSFIQEQIVIGEGDMSKALVALNPGLASLPTPKLKHISRLRTEHRVYELPDSHPLLKGMDRREPDDPSPYLLAIWTPGETADSVQPPESKCSSAVGGGMCNNEACFSCNSTREAQSQTVRGTILIPCRTAMRGSFPLNGTYFQVNEVFADHESSLNPLDVPRSLIWNLPKRTVFFGTSVTSIFKGLSTEDIQFCFWKGLVCVRGFDQKTRAPRPLRARLHFPASKPMTKQNKEK